MNPTNLNIAVLDQQLTFADTVATRLLAQEYVQRATAHTTTDTLMTVVRTEPVDVVLVDWELCAIGPGPLLPELSNERPDVALVVTGTHSSTMEIVAALQAGALGWVPKDMPFEALLNGLVSAARGERWIPGELLTSVLATLPTRAVSGNGNPDALSSLTHRESEVLQCMVDGLHRSQIAQELGMSPNTVRTHVQSVLQKLDVHSSLRAVAIAHQSGLVARTPTIPSQRTARGY